MVTVASCYISVTQVDVCVRKGKGSCDLAGDGMSDEIELKLSVTPKELANLRRHVLLRTLASGRRARRVELESTYFDTPDGWLKAQGMALRVRRQGAKRVQTLKAAVGGDHESLRHVREFEAPVEGERPDLGLIEDEGLRNALLLDDLAARLEPLFTTKVVRHLLPVRLMSSEIEIAFDEGTILAGEVRQPLCELELELLSGEPEYLLQLALAIGEECAFGLEPRSKAARGYALALGGSLPPVTAEVPGLAADAEAGEAFEAIARSCLGQIRANEASMLSGCRDPETVHQLRVGVRRLRAAVSLFQPVIAEGVLVQLKDELKWLQNALGPARDWDVFRLETLAPVLRRLPQEESLSRLAVAAARMGEEAQGAGLAALRSHRFAMLVLRLELWLRNGAWRGGSVPGEAAGQTPADLAEVFAGSALARRSKSVLKRARERDEAVEESLHQLRIAGKKVRYALEFFRPYVKKDLAKEALGLTKQLQDCLGALNDAAVSRRLLDEVGARFPEEVAPRAVGLVLGWQAHRVDVGLSHLEAVWEKARKPLKDLLP